MILQNKLERARAEQTMIVCKWFEESLLETPGIGLKRAAAVMEKVREKAAKHREEK